MKRQPRARRQRRAEARAMQRQLAAVYARQDRAALRGFLVTMAGSWLVVVLAVGEIGRFPGDWRWSAGFGVGLALAGLGLATFYEPAPPSRWLGRWLGRPAFWGVMTLQTALLGAACWLGLMLEAGARVPLAVALPWLPVMAGVAAVFLAPSGLRAWSAWRGL